MKKFLIKISAVTLPFIILLFVMNYAFSKSYWWTVYYTEQEKFSHVPQNIQLANVGSSHGACSFDYDDFPNLTAYNMGISWQHHKYNYYMIKQYVDTFAKNAVLLVPISYFDITRIEEERLYKYYKILEKENFPDWSIKGWLLYKCFPLCSTREIYKKIIMNKGNDPDLIRRKKENLFENEILFSSEMYFNWWMEDNSNIEKGEEGFQYNIEAVSKIIDFCCEHKIIPVLVTTPQADKLNDLYAETDFFNTFYRFTDVLKDKYPSIIYLDYSQDKKYSSDYSLFSDSAHLNNKGAKKFTAQIV